MQLDTSHLIEYLTNLPLLQVPSSLIQTALNEGLRLIRSDCGLIVFFDYEEGREAGNEVDILRIFLGQQAAQARQTLGRSNEEANLLALWLPKAPILQNFMVKGMEARRVLTLPLFNTNGDQAAGFMLFLIPKTVRGDGTVRLSFSPAEISTLSAFCRAVTNSWHSLRSLTSVSQRLEDLVLLNEVATAITSNRDLPGLLQEIMTTTSQLLHAEACTLMLMDRKTDELVFTLPPLEKGGALKEFRQPIGKGISGYVARLGEPVIVNDVTRDPRFNKSVDSNTGFKTKSVMCVPLIVREKTIGVIEVLNKVVGNNFSPNDLGLLLMLAAQAAIAIENAQLYMDLKDERDRLIAKEEEVRRDLGRDLHDGPAQVMAGVAMRISFIKKLFENEPDKVPPALDEVEQVSLQAAKDIRTMMFGLRPLMLETQGLIKTLESYVEKLQSEPWATHLVVKGFGEDETEGRLPYNMEATIFIIIQEALNNIRKHAQPQNVWIELDRSEAKTKITVRDDGKGFDSRKVSEAYNERGSFGLLNMQERARLINASYNISSEPGKGTSISLIISHSNLRASGTNNLSLSLPGT